MRTDNITGKLDIKLLSPSTNYATVSVDIEWDGLANIVRKQQLPILDFLQANPTYGEIFTEEVEECASLVENKLSKEHEKSSSPPAFLQLPKDWRLRGVTRLQKSESTSQSRTEPKTKSSILHLGWEQRMKKARERYFTDHNRFVASWTGLRSKSASG